MNFNPFSTEHSIQVVTFTLTLDAAVPVTVHQNLRARSDLLAELPAVQTPEALEVVIGPDGGMQVPRQTPGIVLSHLRPDGTAAWALRVLGNQIAVECRRYTRWEKVWESAAKYLKIALGAVAGVQPSRNVAVIALNFVDVFEANQENYDLKSLLKPNELLPNRVFNAGPTWHNHIGWFGDQLADGIGWLNQLNVDAVRAKARTVQGVASVSRPIHVRITHNQELRHTARIAAVKASEVLDERMNKLHMNNKTVLGKLLTTEMAKRIGLEVDVA